VLRDKPGDAALHFQLGKVLQKLGRKSAAVEEFKQSSHLNELSHVQGEIAMALLDGIRQLRASNIPQAIKQLEVARSFAPQRPEANFYLGIALSQVGDMENASHAFEQALRVRPTSAEIHYNFGIALWQHQQAAKAVAEFRKAIQLRSDYGVAHCALGLALLKTGASEEGKAEVDLSRKLNTCGSKTRPAERN
jgi:Flp pilus assembly protein TadD